MNKDARREIYWETTVIMLGEPNPELIVDASGKITKLVNVTVKDEIGNSYGLDATIPGNARSRSATSSTTRAASRASAPTSRPSARRSSEIWGNAGLFDFQETWDYVQIFNSSTEDARHAPDRRRQRRQQRRSSRSPSTTSPARSTARRTTESIGETRSSGSHVRVRHQAQLRPTLVEIRNLQPGAIAASNIVLDGPARRRRTTGEATDVTIENPIGTTIVDNRARQHRRQLARREPLLLEPAFLLLRTNILTLNADGGSVGEHVTVERRDHRCAAPVPVELDPVRGRPALTTTAPQFRPITITVEAGTDAVLDLRAVRRETTSTKPLAVTIASFRAGHDADLHRVRQRRGARARRPSAR